MDGVGTLQLTAGLVVSLAVQVRQLGRPRVLVLHRRLRLRGVMEDVGLASEGQLVMPKEPMEAVVPHMGT